MRRWTIGCAFAAIVLSVPAAAGDLAPSTGNTLATLPNTDVVVTAGVGGNLQPRFDGANSYILAPAPIISLKFLRSPFRRPSPECDCGRARA